MPSHEDDIKINDTSKSLQAKRRVSLPADLTSCSDKPKKCKTVTFRDSSTDSYVSLPNDSNESLSEKVRHPREPKRIINKKSYKNKSYYKVEWSDGSEPTWERCDDGQYRSLIKNFERSDRMIDEDESEWEVEEILDKRMKDNRVQYLLKWRHWPGEPTWEYSDNCDCFNLIAAYENPKLKKLWSFSGCNLKLWISRSTMLKYMMRYIKNHRCKVNLLNFKPDFPQDEKQLDLKEGLNIGPLRYENHWYLVIILVNHICVTRRILLGDSLNTLIGVNAKEHPVVKRLSRVYTHYYIKPIRLTQMDRSDVCAFYTLAAFERAIFLLNPDAQFIVENIFFDSSRAELIRSKIKPKTDGQISVALPVPEAFDQGPKCEFCGKRFDSRNLVDDHIEEEHFRHKKASRSSINGSSME